MTATWPTLERSPLGDQVKLYHGTTEPLITSIIQDGLKPRSPSADVNWPNLRSRAGHVYLTDRHGFYFAAGAATQVKRRAVIVEVDAEQLSVDQLYPDEDYLGQMLAAEKFPSGWTSTELMQQTMAADLEQARGKWRDSLDRIGSCSVKGAISSASLLRYAMLDLTLLGPCLHVHLTATARAELSISTADEWSTPLRELTKHIFDRTPDRVSLPEFPCPVDIRAAVEVRAF